MKILEILPEDSVVAELQGRNKEDVIRELASLVADRHREIDRERLVEVLLEREKLGSTAIGEGIAIPHGKLPGISGVVAAFGRSPEGVDFDSLDGAPTRIFFLLVAPEDSSGAHLKALARISRLLRNGTFRERLLGVTGQGEIYEAIREEDDKY